MSAFITKIERSKTLARQLAPLNMFITETFEKAIEQAKELDSLQDREHLYGLTMGVKDCFSTRGVRTTCGSRMLANYVPPYTATVVDKLTKAGCVMVAKTNQDEFSMGSSGTNGYFGPVKNPYSVQSTKLANLKVELSADPATDWHIAGGSSAGSAVSVACGVTDLALGSDTGGSVRNPAAHCGVIGVKPTYGLLSRHGMIPLVNTLDSPGYFCRSVSLAADLLGILSGRDRRDSTSLDPSEQKTSISGVPELPMSFTSGVGNVARLKIGLPKEYNLEELSEEIRDSWNIMSQELELAGADVQSCTLPHTAHSIVTYHVIAECEIASNMARYDGIEFGYRSDDSFSGAIQMIAATRHEAFNEVVRRRVLAGNYFLLKQNYEQYYGKAMKVRRLIAQDFQSVFRDQGFDVLLTPVSLTDAPLYSEFMKTDEGYNRERQDDYFTQPANMAGIPAMTIPVGLSKTGLPIGLQIMADKFQESKMLRVAKWIEDFVKFPGLNVDLLLKAFA